MTNMHLKLQRALRSCLLLFLAFGLCCFPAQAATFPDVDETAEYAEAAEYLSEIGIMEGDPEGNFNPDSTVTRAEMATIICRMLGETENLDTSEKFPDVPTDHWANRYVSKAADLGIITGHTDGTFGPSDAVTYEQAVTMIIRAIGGNEVALEYGGYPDGYLLVAEENGLVAGIEAEKGKALPRSDVARILYNTI